MKILITGGAGFIGSHVAESCIDAGHKIAILDNLSSGNIDNVPKQANLYLMDLLDSEILPVLEKEKPSAVIHLAAQSDVSSSINSPVEDANNNIIGSINLFSCCAKIGINKIIYISTAAVYGEPQNLPVKEDHPIMPLNPYGYSKYVPEMYLRYYQTTYQLNYAILRCANVYGPRQIASAEGGVVAIFIEKLVKGLRPTIYGDGEQTRDFIYVRDIASAALLSLEADTCGVFNIGTCKQVSVNALFSIVCNIISKNPIEPIYAPRREGDIRFNYLDITESNRNLEWKPKYSLEKGLKETFEWRRSIK